MGISVTSFGQLFDRNKDIFRKIGGIIIIVFGLHIMGVVKIKTFTIKDYVTTTEI